MVRRMILVILACLAGTIVSNSAHAPESVLRLWLWDKAAPYSFIEDSQVAQVRGSDLSKSRLERPLKSILITRSNYVPRPALALRPVLAETSQVATQPSSPSERQPSQEKVSAFDPGKRLLESPVKAVLAEHNERGSPALNQNAAMNKPQGLRSSLPGNESAKTTPPPAAPTEMEKKGDDWRNPPVAPGRVRWHRSFALACQAAQRSGKPVLLFQLLGQLDEEFT